MCLSEGGNLFRACKLLDDHDCEHITFQGDLQTKTCFYKYTQHFLFLCSEVLYNFRYICLYILFLGDALQHIQNWELFKYGANIATDVSDMCVIVLMFSNGFSLSVIDFLQRHGFDFSPFLDKLPAALARYSNLYDVSALVASRFSGVKTHGINCIEYRELPIDKLLTKHKELLLAEGRHLIYATHIHTNNFVCWCKYVCLYVFLRFTGTSTLQWIAKWAKIIQFGFDKNREHSALKTMLSWRHCQEVQHLDWPRIMNSKWYDSPKILCQSVQAGCVEVLGNLITDKNELQLELDCVCKSQDGGKLEKNVFVLALEKYFTCQEHWNKPIEIAKILNEHWLEVETACKQYDEKTTGIIFDKARNVLQFDLRIAENMPCIMTRLEDTCVTPSPAQVKKHLTHKQH